MIHSIKRNNTRSISFYIFSILLILILPLNILFISASKRSSSALIAQAEYNTHNILSIYTKEIDMRIERTTYFLNNMLQNNTNCKTVLHQSGNEDYQLSKFLLAQDFIASSQEQNVGDFYFIYSPTLSDILIMKRSNLYSYDNNSIKSWIQQNISTSYNTDWPIITIDGEPFLIHTYFTNNMYIGSLIRLSPYLEDLRQNLDYPTANISYQPNSSIADSNRYLYMSMTPDYSSMTLLVTIDKSDILKELSFLQQYSYYIALVYLLVIPFLLAALHYLFIHPMQNIVNALSQLENGNQKFRISEESHPAFLAKEFYIVSSSFNHMADRINQLRIENYEQELSRQQVELDNLQLTIRPHFLQNTFGVLYTLAQMNETKQLGQFILYLSEYFRYIYQGVHQLAPLSSELSVIHGYLEIVKVQHPEQIEFLIEIPENIEQVLIPPLLIHNFIENIITHALKPEKTIHISLKLILQSKKALFFIQDDGIGIPQDIVAQINQGKPIQNSNRIHVGMYNSYQRLAKIYHENAGMHVSSTIGRGTLVKLWIPVQEYSEKETK